MEFLPRSMISTQLVQLHEAVNMYESAVQTATSSLSVQALQTSCERFLTPVRELESALGAPLDKNKGSSKRYMSSLQMSEVLSGKTMEKIMKYSKRTGESPTESLKVVRAVSNLLSVKHSSTLSREGHQYNRYRNPVQTRLTNPIPVNESKISHTVELPHRFGSAFTPSTSNNSPRVNQQASGSRPYSSYGAACGSKEPLLETSFQAGPATRSGPQGLGSYIQLMQPSAGNVSVWEPQSSSLKIHEGVIAYPGFRGYGSEGVTSDAFFNVAAATSAPAYQNDLLILGEREDHDNESGHFVDESDPDDDLTNLFSTGLFDGAVM